MGAPTKLLGGRSGAVINPGPSWTATLKPSGSNYGIGSDQVGSNPDPASIDGVNIFYLGSFGATFWIAQFGGSGTTQIPGATQINVELAGATPVVLDWNGTQQRYQKTVGEDLNAIFAPDSNTLVPFLIEAV